MDRRRALAGACALAVCPALRAAGVRLQPVALSLAPGETSGTVWIDNPGPQRLDIRAGMFAWSQVAGDERLEPTGEMAVSPARADVPAGGRQRLRVVLLKPPGDDRERSYRLIVDERQEASEVVAARYSLPVFVQADEGAPVQLAASVAELDGATTRLRIDNPSRRHARLVDLGYRAPDGTLRLLAPDLAGYVLPGGHKHWTLPGPVAQFRSGAFEATVNGRPTRLAVE